MSSAGKAAAGAAKGAPAATALPIAAFREELVSMVARHTVTIVKSDTGSGKSTQIPQYLLETSLLAQTVSKGSGIAEAAAPVNGAAGLRNPPVFIPPELWGSKEPRIYVTQPRRVAAVTLAQRVAAERGASVGGLIGYRIGHDAVASAATRVTFCTTGWLLQWLVATSAEEAAPPSSSGVSTGSAATPSSASTVKGAPSTVQKEGLAATHIILDEVHERGIDTDLVILVIKLSLAKAVAARGRAIAALAAASGASGASSKPLQEAAASALSAYASRPRVVLMSATFDTSIFSDYLATLNKDAALPADSPLAGLQLSKLMRSIELVTSGAVPRPPMAAVTGTLGALLAEDVPSTLQVGSKRYPVATVWLEGVYNHPEMKAAGLPRSEAQQVGGACAAFDKAAASWKTKIASSGASANSGVADAVNLTDQAQSAIVKLAARIAVAAARPGGGDCILIFVPGLADIDKVCAAFLEVAPGKVAAPPSRLTSSAPGGGPSSSSVAAEGGEDDACDDEDLLVGGSGGRGKGGKVAHHLVDADDEEEEDEDGSDEDDEKVKGQSNRPKPQSSPAPSSSSDGRHSIRLIPMHSLLSFEDQMAAFDTSGGDKRTRVVIATNIAESSVTLPDVHTCIDLGRAKIVEHVPRLGAPALRTTWISQASAAQRMGRAGRLMPGTIYRMYTRAFHDDVMPRYDLPEMLRLSLDSVVLKVKMLAIPAVNAATGSTGALSAAAKAAPALASPDSTATVGGTSAKAVLSQSIQAPDIASVDSALAKLAALGALSSGSDVSAVTPFGRMLASFPGDLTLGKLVAVGTALGAAADAIVLAAALATGDIFLMPHAAVASSHAEYTSLVAKVTRAKWLFGRDSVLTSAAGADDISGGSSAAAAGSWSEPLAWRNAYIAWRCIPQRERGPWCHAAGIVARRMTTLHSLVREISHRVARDAPGSQQTVAALLQEGGGGGGGARGGRADSSSGSSSSSWPPPGLFTPNTHILRLLLLSAHVSSGLCVGEAITRATAVSHLAGLGVDPSRAVTLRLGQGVPPHWLASLSVRGGMPPGSSQAHPTAGGNRGGNVAGTARGAGMTPSAASLQAQRPFIGDLARSLAAAGVVAPSPAAAISSSSASAAAGGGGSGGGCVTGIVADSRGGAGGGGGKGGKAVGLELAPDWEQQPKGLRVPFGATRQLLGLPNTSSGSGSSSSSSSGVGALGAPSTSTAAAPASGRPTSAAAAAASSSPWSLPLLRSLPVAAQTLLQLGGPRQELALPQPPPDAAADALIAAETGARRVVPGMTDVSGGTAGTGTGSGLVTLECSSAYGLAWKTTGAASGRAAFSAQSQSQLPSRPTATRPDVSSSSGGTAGLTARPSPQAPLRFAGDVIVPPQQLQSLQPLQKGSAPPPPPAPLPLLAVCGSLQLQERMSSGGGKDSGGAGANSSRPADVTAVMMGTTLLWRDPTTLALALLLVGRGVSARLEWKGGNGGPPASVVSVTLDPFGPSPLSIGPTRISLSDLAELNALRAELSRLLATPHLGVHSHGHAKPPAASGASSHKSLLERALALLRVDGPSSRPYPPEPPPRDPSVTSVVADHDVSISSVGGGMEALLPPLYVRSSATAASALHTASAAGRVPVSASAIRETDAGVDSDDDDDYSSSDDGDSEGSYSDTDTDDNDRPMMSLTASVSALRLSPEVAFGFPSRGSAAAAASALASGAGGGHHHQQRQQQQTPKGQGGSGKERKQKEGGGGGGGGRKEKKGSGKANGDGGGGGGGKREKGKGKGGKGRGSKAQPSLSQTIAAASTKTDRERRAAEVTAERAAAVREKEERLASTIGSSWDKLQAKAAAEAAARERTLQATAAAASRPPSAMPQQPRPSTAGVPRPSSAATPVVRAHPSTAGGVGGWGAPRPPAAASQAHWPSLGGKK